MEKDPALHKVPPQNLEAEESVLSAILLDNSTLLDVLETLEPEDFYRSAHAKMFTAITELFAKNEPVDLLICNTYGKYIARDEDVPLLRWGFPILDRQGHQYFPTVGYKGGLRLLEKILDLLLDRKDRDDPETVFELVL